MSCALRLGALFLADSEHVQLHPDFPPLGFFSFGDGLPALPLPSALCGNTCDSGSARRRAIIRRSRLVGRARPRSNRQSRNSEQPTLRATPLWVSPRNTILALSSLYIACHYVQALAMDATHKSRSELGHCSVSGRELRSFFAWLRRQTVVRVPPHDLVGDRNVRRKLARVLRAVTERVTAAYSRAPALQAYFADVLESEAVRVLSNLPNTRQSASSRLRATNQRPRKVSSSRVLRGPLGKMRVWKDLAWLMQAVSVDADRENRERKTELLSVAWIVAPHIGVDHPYDSLILRVFHSRRAVDERRRRCLQRLGRLADAEKNPRDKKWGLLVWKYLEEFRRTKPQKKGELKKFPSLEECKSTDLGAPTDVELESISAMCRARRGLKFCAFSLKHTKDRLCS